MAVVVVVVVLPEVVAVALVTGALVAFAVAFGEMSFLGDEAGEGGLPRN